MEVPVPRTARRKRIDIASSLTLIITVVLFVVAIFEKGLTHDLLLEAGVFLVSAKLALASSWAKISSDLLNEKLDQLSQQISSLQGKK
jgi:hypothetical protein